MLINYESNEVSLNVHRIIPRKDKERPKDNDEKRIIFQIQGKTNEVGAGSAH